MLSSPQPWLLISAMMANLTYLYCRTQNEAALHGHLSYYLTWKHLIVWKIKEAQAQLHLGLITLCVGKKKGGSFKSISFFLTLCQLSILTRGQGCDFKSSLTSLICFYRLEMIVKCTIVFCKYTLTLWSTLIFNMLNLQNFYSSLR